MKIEPVTLSGKFVRLEPLELEAIDALTEAALFPELWVWTNNVITSREDMEKYVAQALSDRAKGTAVPFVTIDAESGQVIGSTRLGNIEPAHRKAEIGWTWITPAFQRTAVNTEAKLLMLTHAFETWHCSRVELKTDTNNSRSRNAIRRLGAVEEGVLRRHMITDQGRFRDSVYYSIIEDEWPAVKLALEAKLGSHAS